MSQSRGWGDLKVCGTSGSNKSLVLLGVGPNQGHGETLQERSASNPQYGQYGFSILCDSFADRYWSCVRLLGPYTFKKTICLAWCGCISSFYQPVYGHLNTNRPSLAIGCSPSIKQKHQSVRAKTPGRSWTYISIFHCSPDLKRGAKLLMALLGLTPPCC